MITSLEETHRRDAWEPLGWVRNGHEEFHSTLSRGGTASGLQCGQTHSEQAEAESGLTRRGKIYEFIRVHPGSHIRATARALGIATGDLQYHLSWLERHGFVKTRKNGFFRSVFPTMLFSEEQEALLAVLSQKTPREILLCLVEDPAITQGQLARRLGYSQPTISWHMSRLVQLGILRKCRTSEGIFHELLTAHDEVVNFVKSYHPGVWNQWAGRLSFRDSSASTTTEDGVIEGRRRLPLRW